MKKVNFILARRFLLWLALGPRIYDYMSRVLREDHRLRTCRMADIVVRKDGKERRIEADWLKSLATIVMGRWRPNMLSKPGLFTWIGDLSAWLEHKCDSGWKLRTVPGPFDDLSEEEELKCEQKSVKKKDLL